MQGGCYVTFKRDLPASFQENHPACFGVNTEMYLHLYVSACISLTHTLVGG
jgi:hypothetical protein